MTPQERGADNANGIFTKGTLKVVNGTLYVGSPSNKWTPSGDLKNKYGSSLGSDVVSSPGGGIYLGMNPGDTDYTNKWTPGTLEISSATTLNSNLTVNGMTTSNGKTTVNGNLAVSDETGDYKNGTISVNTIMDLNNINNSGYSFYAQNLTSHDDGFIGAGWWGSNKSILEWKSNTSYQSGFFKMA